VAVKPGILKYIVQEDCTIEDAWNKIEANRHRSIIVVRGRKVVGTLSDGDIRKAMMAKRLLSTPVRDVMNTNFVSLPPSKKSMSDEVLRKKDIFLVPIVGKNLQILDILTRTTL